VEYVLDGDHTRVKTVVMSKVGGLAAFTKKRVTCVGCRAALDSKGMIALNLELVGLC